MKTSNEMLVIELHMFLEKSGLNHGDFAKVIGVSPNTIVHWFKGRRAVPETLLRTIRYFDQHNLDIMELALFSTL